MQSSIPSTATDSQDFPVASDQGPTCGRATHSLCQCSARAAQDIWEHHRPAVGSSMRALGSVRSTSEKLNGRLSGGPGLSPTRPTRGPTALDVRCRPGAKALPDASRRLLGGRDLTRYRNQPDKSLHQSGAAMHHRPQDQERALNLSIPAVS